MATITIAELDINASKLVKTSADTKKAIQDLKDAQKILQVQGKQNSQEFVKNDVALKKLQKTYREQTKVIGELNLETEEQIDLSKQVTDLTNKQNKSIEGARKNNKDLLAIRNKLNLQTEEGRKALTKINEKLDENNKFIKENVSGYEQQKIGIGDYEGALRRVFPRMNGVLDTLKSTKTSLQAQTAAQKASNISIGAGSKALRIFKIALISTGIGAIIVALGGFITLLSKSQGFINILNQGLSAVGAVVDTLVGVVVKLTKVFRNLFSQPISKTINDAADAFDGLGESIANAIKQGIELEKLRQEVKLLNLFVSRTNATFRKDLELQMAIADDATKSFFERKKANIEAIRLSKLIAEQNIKLATENLNIANQEFAQAQARGALTDEIRQKNTDAFIAFREAEKAKLLLEQNLVKQRAELKQDELERDLDILIDGFDSFKSVQEEKLKNEKLNASQRNEIIDSIRKQADKSFNEQLKTLQQFTKKQIDINDLVAESDTKTLNNKIRSLGLSEIIEGRLLEVIRERRALLKDLGTTQDEENNKELDRTTEFEDRKRELQNEIDLANEKDELDKQLLKTQQDFDNQQLELERLTLTSEERQELLVLLTTQEEQVIADIKQKFAEDAIKKQLEVNKKVLDADKKNAQARADVASTLTGILRGLLGDSLGAKLAGIAIEAAIQAGLVSINTSSAQATNLAQATATAPPPLNIPFIAAAIAQNTVLQGESSAAISKIISSAALQSFGTLAAGAFYEGGKVPTRTGGRITGQNIRTQKGGDNIFATVKSGEVILNDDQQARAGGSAFFKSIGVPGFQAGGVVADSVTSPTGQGAININQFADALAERVNLVKVVAIEEEITAAQDLKANIVNAANI